MRIAIIGAGYVGLSNAIHLSQKNTVELIDIDKKKVKDLRSGQSPIKDNLIEEYLTKKNPNLSFSSKLPKNLKNYEIVIIAIPTNFHSKINSFDTKGIQKLLKDLKRKEFSRLVVIRSTVPIGFTKEMQLRFPEYKIAFFPEFLREGNALKDCLYPSRIICGSRHKYALDFLNQLKVCSLKKNIRSLITTSSEAESIKLFSNSFLAMRVAFFNELDSFAMLNGHSTSNIINGVSLDKRIGNFYNNPSFGYGGYCLPKDIKQLKNSFSYIPENLISGTIKANKTRKNILIKSILLKNKNKIGVYKLSMKADSDNWRESSIIDIFKELKTRGLQIKIFDRNYNGNSFQGIKVEHDLNKFLSWSELILANRKDSEISNKGVEVYSRDIFGRD